MKKNYTLKITLAMLIVVLVSLVSFVGVYKGKSLLKEYSLGKDLSERQIAKFSIVEEEEADVSSEQTVEDTSDEENSEDGSEDVETDESEEEQEENTETSENTEVTENSESTDNESEPSEESIVEDKEKKFKKAKDILEKRLVGMKAEDFEIRIQENGDIEIEVPTDVSASSLNQITKEGKIEVKNQSTNETVVDSNGFKNATARIDSTSYTKPIVTLNIKFTNAAKKTFKDVNTKYTDSEGNESEATFAITLDGSTLYSDTASNFVSTAKNGSLDLVLGQGDEGEDLEEDYKSALIVVSQISNETLPVQYQFDSLQIVKSNINIKTIIVVSCIVAAIMFVYALYKYKTKSILPVLSLAGLVGAILLVLRYTNVKITLFTILGLALVTIINYIFILKTLGNDKSFKDNFVETMNVLIPFIIIAVVFCCSPYLQVASLGMSMFWGTIIMFIYNIVITRVLINK